MCNRCAASPIAPDSDQARLLTPAVIVTHDITHSNTVYFKTFERRDCHDAACEELTPHAVSLERLSHGADGLLAI